MDKSKGRSDPRRGRRRGPRPKPTNGNGNEPSTRPEPTVHAEPVVPRSSDVVPNSRSEPVPSDTPTFSSLAGSNLVHPTVLQAITEDMKFTHMMPVQAATLRELLPPNRHDCLVQAKTGTGKTMAFLLPAVQTMINRSRGSKAGISLLVISPTRELAQQIASEANNLLQRLPQFRVRVAIGGTNKDREEKQILSGCDILIATPGRLFDHMSNEDITYAFRHLDTLVLDEADRLLDMGFKKALKDIVDGLPNKKETERQGMLFSATMGPHVDQAAGLVLSPGYKFISTIPQGDINTHERVPQLLVKVPSFSDVAPAMVGSVREEATKYDDFKAIIFAPTANLADFYGTVLNAIPGLPPVSVLHSRISQSRRSKTSNDYRDAKSAILIATDVVARGMDFPGVTTVFQVGIPSDKQSYIHRLGRTARASADGSGVFIVCDAEEWFPRWTLKEITFTTKPADLSSASQVLGIATNMEESDKSRIYQAWMGYYNNHLKSLRWDKTELVAQANIYARDGLGSPETPTIARTTAGKMGLRGTRGLVIVPDPPRQGRGRPQSAPGRGKRGRNA